MIIGLAKYFNVIPAEYLKPEVFYAIIAIAVIAGLVVLIFRREQLRLEGKDGETPDTESFYNACNDANSKSSHSNNVIAISRFPILLLESERISKERRAYYSTVNARLGDQDDSYNLRYLVDKEGLNFKFEEFLKLHDPDVEYRRVRAALDGYKDLVLTRKIEIKCAETGYLYSLVIAEENDVVMGFRVDKFSRVTDGVRIHSIHVAKILSQRFNDLFRTAHPLDVEYLDQLWNECKATKQKN